MKLFGSDEPLLNAHNLTSSEGAFCPQIQVPNCKKVLLREHRSSVQRYTDQLLRPLHSGSGNIEFSPAQFNHISAALCLTTPRNTSILWSRLPLAKPLTVPWQPWWPPWWRSPYWRGPVLPLKLQYCWCFWHCETRIELHRSAQVELTACLKFLCHPLCQ